MPRIHGLGVIILLALGLPADGQEWTRFRGPDGGGISESTTIPSQFSEKDFNWTTPLPGGGHSSPVVWGERIFLTCADDETARGSVVCVSATDGKILWTREQEAQPYRKHGDNSYASHTPAVDAQHVYVCWSTPESLTLAALTHEGEPAWSVDLGPYAANHGGGMSPIVWEDLVILPNDNDRESFLVAFEGKTGEERWRTPRHSDKFSASTPCVFRPQDAPAQLVFSAKVHGLTGVDPQTGAVLWEVTDAWNNRTVGSPVAGEGLIIGACGEGGGGTMLTAVKPGTDSSEAEVAYRLTEKVPYVPTPLVYNGLLFYWADSGIVTCARPATGETIWQERVGGAGGYFASPICVDGRLFNVSKQGDVLCIVASDKFELLGKSKLPFAERTHATPAVSGGRMYLRTYTHLVSVGGAGLRKANAKTPRSPR